MQASAATILADFIWPLGTGAASFTCTDLQANGPQALRACRNGGHTRRLPTDWRQVFAPVRPTGAPANERHPHLRRRQPFSSPNGWWEPRTADLPHAHLSQQLPRYCDGPTPPSQTLGRWRLPPSSLNLPGSCARLRACLRAPACELACARAQRAGPVLR